MLRKLLLLALFASLLTSACRRSTTSTPDIVAADVTARMGTGLARDDRAWTSLRVEATNAGADFDGHVVVRGMRQSLAGGVIPTPVSFRAALALPSGTRRSIEIPVRSDGWSAALLRFESAGYERIVRVELPQRPLARVRALVVGAEVPNLTPLRQAVASRFLKAEDSSTLNERPIAEFSPIDPSALPESPLGLSAHQLVVVWGDDLTTATEPGFEALAEWTRRGGTLVALAGDGWAQDGARRLRELLRIETGGAAEPLPVEHAAAFGSAAEGVYYRPLTPSAGATAREDGLVVDAAVGAGRVRTLALRPTGRAAPSIAEAPALHRLLEPAIARALSFSGDAAGALSQIEGTVPSTLQRMTGFRVPHVGAVLLGVLAYLFVGFVVPAIVFHRRRRREWAFAWILATAALAIVGIYFLGLLSTVEDSSLEEIAVLRVHADGRTAEATSLVCAISPRISRLDTSPRDPEPPALSAPLRALRLAIDGTPDDSEEIGTPATTCEARPAAAAVELPPITLYPNGPRYLRFDYRHVDTSSVELGRDAEGRLTIRNRTEGEAAVILIGDGRLTGLKRLAPGAEHVVDDEAWSGRGDLVIASEPSTKMARSLAQAAQYGSPWAVVNDWNTAILGDWAGTAGAPALLATASLIDRPDSEAALSPNAAWQAMTDGDGEEVALVDRPEPTLLSARPRHVVVITREPALPRSTGLTTRRAWTLRVHELSPESTDEER